MKSNDPATLERLVRPSDCALALALPMSRAELLADMASPCPSDFARGLTELRPSAPMDQVAAEYEEQIAVGRRVVSFAQHHGVTVVHGVTLAGLADLTDRFRVVSVFAHAPNRAIRPRDILDAGALTRAVFEGSSSDHARLHWHLSRAGIALDEGAPPSREDLARALNRANWTLDLTVTRTAAQMDRTRMEDALPGRLRPAPVLELADGLHCLEPIRAVISPAFKGVLDLSACTSVVLAEALKRTRNDFVAIGTVRPTIPLHRFLLYELRLREMVLRREPVSFTAMNRFVAKGLELAAAR